MNTAVSTAPCSSPSGNRRGSHEHEPHEGFPAASPRSRASTPAVDWFGRRILAGLAGLKHGELSVAVGSERHHFGQPTSDGLRSHVEVHDSSLFRELVFSGSLGAGDAYLDGSWTASDLTAMLRIVCRNMNELSSLESVLTLPVALAQRGLAFLARNTRTGSRRNIARHYDLSNELFQLFLDPTMMYSSALFESETMTLEQASIAKLDRVCRVLDLKPGDRVVEIGTGWGGFALYAARNYGCEITTTTISRNQHAIAAERIAQAGLNDRITLLTRDYRDLAELGTFDKLVSIEMIEAVGQQFLPRYFQSCCDLLKPGGQMLVQGIIMPESRYAAYCRTTDFIRKHVFPGGHLPSVGAMLEAASGTRLLLREAMTFPDSYARTLREWRARFFERLDDVRALGFDERFIRLWDYYLCYCEAAFLERAVTVGQYVWEKTGC